MPEETITGAISVVCGVLPESNDDPILRVVIKIDTGLLDEVTKAVKTLVGVVIETTEGTEEEVLETIVGEEAATLEVGEVLFITCDDPVVLVVVEADTEPCDADPTDVEILVDIVREAEENIAEAASEETIFGDEVVCEVPPDANDDPVLCMAVEVDTGLFDVVPEAKEIFVKMGVEEVKGTDDASPEEPDDGDEVVISVIAEAPSCGSKTEEVNDAAVELVETIILNDDVLSGVDGIFSSTGGTTVDVDTDEEAVVESKEAVELVKDDDDCGDALIVDAKFVLNGVVGNVIGLV